MIALVHITNGTPTGWLLANNLAELKFKARGLAPDLAGHVAALSEPLPLDLMRLTEGVFLLTEPVVPPDGGRIWT
jgi:hypothetical protein